MQIRRRLVSVYGWHLILIGSLFPEITFLNSPACHSCAWCCVKGMKATGREHPSLQTRQFLFQALALRIKKQLNKRKECTGVFVQLCQGQKDESTDC